MPTNPYQNIFGSPWIGDRTKIGAFVEIGPGVVIGDDCKIEAYTFIPSGVEIGNNVFIGPRVTFTNDKFPRSKGQWTLLSTKICDGASIGAGCIILPGVTIGENCMIGAGTLVTKSIPPNMKYYQTREDVFKSI